MGQYIDKSAVMAKIKERINSNNEKAAYYSSGSEHDYLCRVKEKVYKSLLSFLNTLEVKEVETSVIPKYSYFEHIYHCGSKPMWKIGDVLAVYEFYSDHEGEYVYGKITDVKMDENEDWCYTFENGEVQYENMLISDEAYKKN